MTVCLWSADDVKSGVGDVDSLVDTSTRATTAAEQHHQQVDSRTSSQQTLPCETSSQQTLPRETSPCWQPTSSAHIKQEPHDDSSETVNCKPQDRQPGLHPSELALILKLQRDIATMQLQLSNLQDALRTANGTLQLLLYRVFNSQ